MFDRMPEYIDPVQLADKQGILKGQIPLSSFDRLQSLLFDETGSVDVYLFFNREGRLAKVSGQIKTKLSLQCQNCLNPLAWEIDSSITLGIVNSIDQMNRLPEDVEPLIVQEEGKVLVKDLIEDEILLILPDFPKHPHQCFAAAVSNINKEMSNDQHSLTENPFSILAKLKKTGD